MTTSGTMTIERDGGEIEVYVEIDWIRAPHISGSSVLAPRAFYLDKVFAWHDGVEVELTDAERATAIWRFPWI